jgi:PAS domain S-box-containing protein
MLVGSFWVIEEVNDFKKGARLLRETYSENKKSEIKKNILEIKDWIYWVRSHPPDAVSGELNMQKYCLDSLSRIRYAKDEYVFINTYEGKALASNGKINEPPVDILNTGDTAWIGIFRIEQLAETHPSGFFYSYMFNKISASNKSLKTSYFSYLPEWKWIIGTGFYQEDVNSVIDQKRKELFSVLRKRLFKVAPILIFSVLLSFIIVMFFSRRLAKNIEIFKNFFTKVAGGQVLIDKSQVSYKEFEILAENANRMVEENMIVDEALRLSEEKYRLLFEHNPASMLIYERNTFNLLALNEAFLNQYGYSEEEALRMHLADLYPDDEKAAIMELAQSLHGHVYTGEWHHIKKDGSVITIIASSHDLIFMERDARIAVVTDISERKLAEEELKLHRNHLEELVIRRTAELEIEKEHAQSADRLKSAFLATMSHELRTPLNSIIGFTGILMQERPGPLNDEQKKQLGMTQNSARHLLSLINDVLDISKIEAGQLKIIVQNFSLPEVINKVVETSNPFADKKNLKLTVAIEDNVSEIRSDKLRVHQILLNLVNNAIKFTDAGSIIIECQKVNDHIKIKISDTGMGIENDKLELLFKPFMQIDTGLTRKYEGTGLGLSICRKLTEMLNGKIEVESVYGSGSTFTITLPMNLNI